MPTQKKNAPPLPPPSSTSPVPSRPVPLLGFLLLSGRTDLGKIAVSLLFFLSGLFPSFLPALLPFHPLKGPDGPTGRCIAISSGVLFYRAINNTVQQRRVFLQRRRMMITMKKNNNIERGNSNTRVKPG